MATICSRPSLLVLCCLCCFWMLTSHVHPAGLSFNLSFSEPKSLDLSQLIVCTGDAFISSDTLMLTQNRPDLTGTFNTGRAKYNQLLPLWDAATGETASFTTTFSFKMTPDPSTGPGDGDGMAFFLAMGWVSSNIPENSAGGSLGLLPTSTNGSGMSNIVAVEFDTFLNLLNADISSNHVGIDLSSLNSTASRDTTSATNNLTSGYTMVATVRYENTTQLLDVHLNINDKSYNVSAKVEMRDYLPEHVAVGFSAATGVAGQQNEILSWSFASTLEARIQATVPETPLPQTPDVTTSNSKRRPMRVEILIAVLVPLLSVLACAAVGLLVWQQQHKRRSKQTDGASDSDCEEQDELERGVAASGPRRYTYRELAAATSNFAEDHKLGRGGFGSVYRGKLSVCGEDRPVAIKMLSSESSAQGRKEFEAEVRIISRLKHRNLVQLLGWCDSHNGLLLVYELVAEGSLDKHLYSSRRLLTWIERYQIILGLGSALRYLHHEWEQCVVHGDIKPSNIMLDESLCTKLGDFGLARLADHGARLCTTNAVLGTAGYIDPEFVNTRHPSTHSDVYSFGIALLEIVSSRSPVIMRDGGPPFILLKWVWSLYGRDAILEGVDERLRVGDDIDAECMERVLVVGLWCAHPDQIERPSIVEAMHVLQSDDARLPTLTPQMYRTAPDFAVTGCAYGAFSVESYNGESPTKTGDSKLSSGSSTTALLCDSKEKA